LIVSMLTGAPFARATTPWTWCMERLSLTDGTADGYDGGGSL
jgi:hypothetical protein